MAFSQATFHCTAAEALARKRASEKRLIDQMLPQKVRHWPHPALLPGLLGWQSQAKQFIKGRLKGSASKEALYELNGCRQPRADCLLL